MLKLLFFNRKSLLYFCLNYYFLNNHYSKSLRRVGISKNSITAKPHHRKLEIACLYPPAAKSVLGWGHWKVNFHELLIILIRLISFFFSLGQKTKILCNFTFWRGKLAMTQIVAFGHIWQIPPGFQALLSIAGPGIGPAIDWRP